MNEVDFLLRTPFNGLTLDEKLELKRLGPHQPDDFEFEQQFRNRKRNFYSAWYKKYEWLTVSLKKRRLFCFYCLLYEDNINTDKTWSSAGFDDLNHIYRSAKKHENSEAHLTCAIRYKLLKTLEKASIATQLDHSVVQSIKKHNERVDKNRHILNRIIDCIKLCGTHDLPIRGHDESDASSIRGVFLNLLELLASLDRQLEDHLSSASVKKCTSDVIQNDILDCIYDVYRESILCEINDAEYVAIEADETTDFSGDSQFVVILRYCKDSVPVERVLKFIEVHDRSARGLAGVLMKELEPLNIKTKLIAQAFDGSCVMSGASGGVQTLIQAEYPHAHYVHSYAHQLNLILKRVVEHIPSVRLFFSNLVGFSSFFSVSPKRSDALKTACYGSLPSTCQTQWNFQSGVIESVHNNKDSLRVCFENIIGNPDWWDDNSIREACGLQRLLEDETFIYFLSFFRKIFGHVEILYNIFQACVTNGTDAATCINDFIDSIQKIRDSLEEGPSASTSKRELSIKCRSSVKANASEVCEVLMTHLPSRFTENLFLTSFAALSPANFVRFKTQFPDDLFKIIIQKYPFLCSEKLKSELKVIYQNESFLGHNCDSVTKLNSAIISTGLHTNFTETTKVLKIILTTPTVSAEPERCFSTLKRVKNFLLSTMDQDRLNALMILSIHEKMINTIGNFNAKVVQKFAEMKTHRADFVYQHYGSPSVDPSDVDYCPSIFAHSSKAKNTPAALKRKLDRQLRYQERQKKQHRFESALTLATLSTHFDGSGDHTLYTTLYNNIANREPAPLMDENDPDWIPNVNLPVNRISLELMKYRQGAVFIKKLKGAGKKRKSAKLVKGKRKSKKRHVSVSSKTDESTAVSDKSKRKTPSSDAPDVPDTPTSQDLQSQANYDGDSDSSSSDHYIKQSSNEKCVQVPVMNHVLRLKLLSVLQELSNSSRSDPNEPVVVLTTSTSNNNEVIRWTCTEQATGKVKFRHWSSLVGNKEQGDEKEASIDDTNVSLTEAPHSDTTNACARHSSHCLQIRCAEVPALIHLDKFHCPGINRQCIEYQKTLRTPEQFISQTCQFSPLHWQDLLTLPDGIALRELFETDQLSFTDHDSFCTQMCSDATVPKKSLEICSASQNNQTNKTSTMTMAVKAKERFGLAVSCGAESCKNGRCYPKCKGQRLIPPPRDESRCKIWLQNMNRHDLMGRTPIELRQSGLRVCSCHFDLNQFAGFSTFGERFCLRQKAVPTVFHETSTSDLGCSQALPMVLHKTSTFRISSSQAVPVVLRETNTSGIGSSQAVPVVLRETNTSGIGSSQAVPVVLRETNTSGIGSSQAVPVVLREMNTSEIGFSQAVPVVFRKTNTRGIGSSQAVPVILRKTNTSEIGSSKAVPVVLRETNKSGLGSSKAVPVLQETNKSGISSSQAVPIVLREMNASGIGSSQAVPVVLRETNTSGIDSSQVAPVILCETKSSRIGSSQAVPIVFRETNTSGIGSSHAMPMFLSENNTTNRSGFGSSQVLPIVLRETGTSGIGSSQTLPIVLHETGTSGIGSTQGLPMVRLGVNTGINSPESNK